SPQGASASRGSARTVGRRRVTRVAVIVYCQCSWTRRPGRRRWGRRGRRCRRGQRRHWTNAQGDGVNLELPRSGVKLGDYLQKVEADCLSCKRRKIAATNPTAGVVSAESRPGRERVERRKH